MRKLFIILLLLALIPNVSAWTVTVYVTGHGSIRVANEMNQTMGVITSTTSYNYMDFTVSDYDRIYLNEITPGSGYTFDYICKQWTCEPFNRVYEDVDGTEITEDTMMDVRFVPNTQLLSNVHGQFNDHTTAYIFWAQSSNADINLTMDGNTVMYENRNAGSQYKAIYDITSYGQHIFCVENECIQLTNTEPEPIPTPTPTPTPEPTTSILTIVQIVGNGTLEVYDNDVMIGNIQSSHSFNVSYGHNVTIHALPNTGYHVDKICDYNGCIADSTKTTYISNLDFIAITATFIQDSIVPPIQDNPDIQHYSLSIANTPIGTGNIYLWLNNTQQPNINSAITYNLTRGTFVKVAYMPYSGSNYLKNATINGVVNTSTEFIMTQNYVVVAHWTEDVNTLPESTPINTPSWNNNPVGKSVSPDSNEQIIANFWINLPFIVFNAVSIMAMLLVGAVAGAIGVVVSGGFMFVVGTALGLYPSWVTVILGMLIGIKSGLFK